jgi:hypothetical protein
LHAATRSIWRVDDLIGADKPLNFTKPFLPEALSHTQTIACLSPNEQLILNHIRGNSYLHLFGLVEEFILPLVVNHVQTIGCDDILATQAYLTFAAEESKHIHLFRQFAKAFETRFGTPCEVIGPPKAIADFVLQHSPLGVALVTLHIEWMTQRHFLDSVRNQQGILLDPQFCSLLKHHWQEEAQHARLDALMVLELAKTMNTAAISAAMDDYIAIIHYLNAGLKAQVQLDLVSLERSRQRTFTVTEQDEIRQVQEKSYQKAFIHSGMTHPNFVQSVQELGLTGYEKLAILAQTFA